MEGLLLRKLRREEFDVVHRILVDAAEWLMAKGIRQWTTTYPKELYLIYFTGNGASATLLKGEETGMRSCGFGPAFLHMVMHMVILSAAVGCQSEMSTTTGIGTSAAQANPASPQETLVARAKSFELNTPYVPPPGDPLEHNTSGYAKTMCSAVFITGLDPDVAAESVGYFTGPYEERKKVSKPVVDREKKEVRITLPNGVAVVARYFGIAGMHHAAARTKRRFLQAG